jgi:hypothetical protein
MSTEMLFVSTDYYRRLPYQEGVFVQVRNGEASITAAGLYQYCSPLYHSTELYGERQTALLHCVALNQ